MASKSDRMEFCERCARYSSHGNDQLFFFGAFTELFDTTDPGILSGSIEKMAKAVDALGGAVARGATDPLGALLKELR